MLQYLGNTLIPICGTERYIQALTDIKNLLSEDKDKTENEIQDFVKSFSLLVEVAAAENKQFVFRNGRLLIE